jgi:hypothetical protein
MPASAAQVFGPTTVDPGFTSTGEKTLLTMNTTLPAGGINVVIVSFVRSDALQTEAQGTYRIYKGSTLLYESKLTEYFNYSGMRARHVLLIAVDTSPAGNDNYYFKINITTAGTATGSVHVQGIVVKTDDAVWGYNTTAVSIEAGATATITSISTSFPANSKVAIIAVAYGSHTSTGSYLIGAGNVKLKSGATVISSNQFNVGSYQSTEPFWVSLVYLDTPASSSQTYSVEITNGSSVAFNCYAEVVAFTVYDGAFLDTGSVALTSGSQVTVGNLTTALLGNVVVIGLAAAENTSSTSGTAFNAGDVVLQLNNSATGQISNLVGWYFGITTAASRSGILPLFRLDSGVSNPSYQIKMTARVSGINGEAKILAFTISLLVSVSDSGSGAELITVGVTASDYGSGVDAVNMKHEALDSGSGIDSILSPRFNQLTDSGGGVDAVYVSASVAAYDSGIGTDIIGIVAQISVEDFGTGVEFADWFLSMYGIVLIDNDDVGIHSIPYKDWRQRNIPVQVHRRSVGDKVYIDSDEVGDVVVEWEDKVSDVVPGERTLIVTGVVELYD